MNGPLWNPEVQCHIHKGSPIIPILSRINPIPRIDTHFFKIHSNIILHLRLGFPKGLFPVGIPVKILKTLLPSSILATWSDIDFNTREYILNDQKDLVASDLEVRVSGPGQFSNFSFEIGKLS